MRRSVVWLISWNFFDNFVLLAIVINSISLACYDYSDRNSTTLRNQIIDKAGIVFTAIFTLECVLKVIGMGFIVGTKAYIRNGWNVLDFAVVIAGLLELVGSVNLKSLRVLRVLRPLRSINAVPSMKKLVSALLKALPDFANVAVFLLFIFLLFSILGCHQYNGVLYNACRFNASPESPHSWAINSTESRVCSQDSSGDFQCAAGETCGNPAQFGLSPSDDDAIDNQRINYGIGTFDNIGTSLLTVFQVITLDHWTTIMYNLMDGDLPILAAIYFFFLVIFGSFFLMNLILAVIVSAFIKIEQKELEEKIGIALKGKNSDTNLREMSSSMIQQNNVEVSIFPQLTVEDFDDQANSNFLLSPMKTNNAQEQELETLDKDNDLLESKRIATSGEDSNKAVNLKKGITFSHFNGEEKKSLDNLYPKNDKFAKSIKNQEQINILNELNKLTKAQKQSDLQFLKPSAMKRKTVGIFLATLKESQIKEVDPKIEQTPEMSQFLAIQAKKIMQKEFMKRILAETLNKSNPKQATSIRQLATAKLGFKLQNQGLTIRSQLAEFEHENRAKTNKFYYFAFIIMKSAYFQAIVSLTIVANTIVLSLDRYPIQQAQTQKMELANIGFSIVFIIEMIIKLIGLGIKGYYRDPFNTFDCIIVITSVIDFSFTLSKSSSGASGVTALRAFRLLRIFKLAKSWKKFQHLLKTIGRTLKDVSTFSILLFLLMFTYTLLGMDLFAYKAKFDTLGKLDMLNGEYPDSNFNEFLDAFTSIFIVLANDGWGQIYYNYYRAVNAGTATVFFISLVIIGQKILLNLFLAILLENFDVDSLNQEIKQNFKKQIEDERQKNKSRWQILKEKVHQYFKSGLQKSSQNQNQTVKVGSKGQSFGSTLSVMPKIKIASTNQSNENSPAAKRGNAIVIDEEPMLGTSLYLFSDSNRFREIIHKIVTWRHFDHFILLTIGLSAIQLALENPLNDPNGQLEKALFYIDMVTTIIFTVEMILKIISFGFIINGPNCYLRSPWNLMDFIIVIFSIVSLSAVLDKLKIFKMFRILRPLRIISKNEGLKIAVKSLVMALPDMVNIIIIMLLFFICFGIIGISYFKGKMFYCKTDFILYEVEEVPHKWDCFNNGGEWVNPDSNFDNIQNSMRTLFLLSTTSDWTDIMYACMATTQIDYAGTPKSKPYWAIFFIVFIIVGAFFLINLFVGVVISTFNRERESIGGNDLLTDKQREWLYTRLLMLKSKPTKILRPPQNRFRRIFFNFTNHPKFDITILSFIILNTLVLMMKWYQQPQIVTTITDIVNYIFTAIFTLEAIFKLISLGKGYFSEKWNIFDFLIVVITLASVAITPNTKVNLKGTTNIIRSFRVLRIFRLIKRAKSLSQIFNTFLVTLPAMANTGGLLFLLIYLYSIIGMTLFSQVQRGDDFTDILNFESFTHSFLVMFKIATGDGWNGILSGLEYNKDLINECIENPSYSDFVKNGFAPIGCGSNISAFLFFYSYILLVNLIFLNLFIAIILQGFDDVQSRDNRQLNPSLLENFKLAWAKFDPEATTFIKISELKDLLLELGEPLGWGESYANTRFLQEKFIKSLELPVYNNSTQPVYQFMDVMKQLSFKLLVSEQINKQKTFHKDIDEEVELSGSEEERKNTDQIEKEVKQDWEKDINILEFQQTHQNILAVKHVNKNEEKVMKNLKTPTRDSHYTSSHYAAAEVVVDKMKYLTKKKKLRDQLLTSITKSNQDNQRTDNNDDVDNINSREAFKGYMTSFTLSSDKQELNAKHGSYIASNVSAQSQESDPAAIQILNIIDELSEGEDKSQGEEQPSQQKQKNDSINFHENQANELLVEWEIRRVQAKAYQEEQEAQENEISIKFYESQQTLDIKDRNGDDTSNSSSPGTKLGTVVVVEEEKAQHDSFNLDQSYEGRDDLNQTTKRLNESKEQSQQQNNFEKW